MRPIENDSPTGSFWVPSYDELLASMEHEIVVKVEDNDYQGDTRVLLKDGERYGLLFFGWGSCSGCDALEGCSSAAEAEALRDQLYDSIEWHSGIEALRKRIDEGDWDAKYDYGVEQRDFLSQVASICGSTRRFDGARK